MKGISLFNRDIACIDLGSNETKIIAGNRSKNCIAIKKAFSFNTPQNSYENGYIKDEIRLLDAVSEELKRNSILKSPCHITIKSTAALTREILIPTVSSKEVEGLLRYQLAECLPMDPEKYVVQHRPIDRIAVDGKEKLNIFVVAIPKDIVEMHYNFLKELGLKPEVMDYQSNGLAKLLAYSDRVNEGISLSQKNVAAIDLGYYSTEITIISGGSVKISRVLDTGGLNLDKNISALIDVCEADLQSYKQSITDVSSVEESYSDCSRYMNIVRTSIENIMSRIDKIFKYYASKGPDSKIEALVLHGGLSGIKGIEKLFNNYFGIPAVVLYKADKVHIAEDVNKYANCIGALIRDDGVQ